MKPKSSKRMKGRGSDESLKVWISDLGEGREERRRRREKRMRRRKGGEIMRCMRCGGGGRWQWSGGGGGGGGGSWFLHQIFRWEMLKGNN